MCVVNGALKGLVTKHRVNSHTLLLLLQGLTLNLLMNRLLEMNPLNVIRYTTVR